MTVATYILSIVDQFGIGGQVNLELTKLENGLKLTNCAAMKALISKIPGRSTNDQLCDLVTKINA